MTIIFPPKKSSAPRPPRWHDPANQFLLLGLISGLALLLLLPPMQVADEWRHFYRAYLLAEGEWLGKGLGDNIPQELQRLTWETEGYLGIPTRGPKPWPEMAEFLRRMAALEINKAEVQYVSFPTVLYAPVPYLGMTAAIAFGHWWTESPLILMYLGRLGGLLLALYLTWYAIRLVPFGKWAFFLIAMTPVLANQRAGLSADSLINALAMLYVAMVLAATCGPGQKMQLWKIARLGIVTVALCLCKQAYLILPLLSWVIPSGHYTRPGDCRAVRYWFPLLGWAAAVFWATTVMHHNYSPMMAGTDAMAQLRWIITNPGTYLIVLANDLVTHGHQYLHELIGTLGWLDVPTANILVLTHAAVLLGVSLAARDTPPLTLFIRGWSWIILLASLGLVWTLMYLWWVPVGALKLSGMQGRYFAPFLPLLPVLVSLPHKKGAAVCSSWSNKAQGLLPAILGLYALFLAIETAGRIIFHYYK